MLLVSSDPWVQAHLGGLQLSEQRAQLVCALLLEALAK